MIQSSNGFLPSIAIDQTKAALLPKTRSLSRNQTLRKTLKCTLCYSIIIGSLDHSYRNVCVCVCVCVAGWKSKKAKSITEKQIAVSDVRDK